MRKGRNLTLRQIKKWLVWRTVMIQRALYSPDPGERFTYSERMRMTREKVSMGFWSHSLRQSPTQNGELDRASGTWISKFHSKVNFPSIKKYRLSHGHDSTCATFPSSRKMFYILRTFAYDAWKIFYRLPKSNALPETHTKLSLKIESAHLKTLQSSFGLKKSSKTSRH